MFRLEIHAAVSEPRPRFFRHRVACATILQSLLGFAIFGCSNSQKGISSGQALKICRDHLLAMAHDTAAIQTRLIPDHPITIDSIITDQVHLFYSNKSVWLARVRDSLVGRTFWRCGCWQKKESLDGAKEIYIDRTSARVLYVYP
jgi:hypothetical protein